jgi:hypothetical protein
MSGLRNDPSREAIERLLDGRGGMPVALAQLVSAARSAPRPGELDGEEAAVAAFRSAQRSLGRARPAGGIRGRTTARLLAAVGAIAVASGVGVAAATGALPGDGWGSGHPSVSRPAVPKGTFPARTPQQPGATGATSTGGTDGAAGPVAGPGGTADLLGLCRAYLAMPPREAQRALGTPAFAQLVGHTSDVGGFCTALTATPSATPGGRQDQPSAYPPKPTPEPRTKSPRAKTE